MSRRIFRAFMTHGSVILFVAFLLSFAFVFLAVLLGYWEAESFMAKTFMDENMWPVAAGAIIRSFAQAFGFSAMLLLGAALLFRADKFLEAAE